MTEQVILVDRRDRPVGVEEKLKAHRDGSLHRAFSVFLFHTDTGSVLLQQRAWHKYHSGGLWSNTCCSHPRPGEPTLAAAHRRLGEEMGIDCALTPAFGFVYRARLDGGLVEHEYDHVLLGRFAGVPVPNPDEVAGWRWSAVDDLRRDVARSPDRYTIWFRIALDALLVRPQGERHETRHDLAERPAPPVSGGGPGHGRRVVA